MGPRYFLNAHSRSGAPYSGLFQADEYEQVAAFFESHPEMTPTRLETLRDLGGEIGIGPILVKDESRRFGLNAFKILGVTYAIERIKQSRQIQPGATLACATEGNHGRAVARVASRNGLQSRIFVSKQMAPARIAALHQEGARVVVVDGNYDDSVHRCAAEASANDWTVVSDTAWPGYEQVPRWIMAGYTRLRAEASAQWQSVGPPDIVLVQAGVGGLAAAVVSWLCHRFGERRPFVVVCEPIAAACCLESAQAERPVRLPGPFDTMLAGLRCGEVSSIAWPVLHRAVDAFVAIDDRRCIETLRRLAHPNGDDPELQSGPSGCCGLAGLLAITEDESLRPVRDAAALKPETRALAIITEGPEGVAHS
ncbi:MAG: diaminopropionate ammonia-lyase [Acidobacteriota bacterium]